MAQLIQDVEVEGCVQAVVIEDGRITAMGPDLIGGNYASVYQGSGCALIPGLHDHHIHLNATAAAMNSIPNGPNRPVRIQHRSGRLWILNSLAMEALNITVPKNGRLLDSDTLLRTSSAFPDLKPVVQKLLSYGITGVTEVTPSNGMKEYSYYQSAAKPLRLSVMGRAELSPEQSRYLKLHYHDHDLPPLERLANEISDAHQTGRNIAVHCVTRAELMLTLAALEMAGAMEGDRIEHAAIADKAAIDWMKRLGVIVVTQPNFIAERIEAYSKDVETDDLPHLWRLKTFKEAGLRLAAGSDAPFGDPNPWAAMAAAVKRPRGFEAEAVEADTALGLYTKPWDNAGAQPRRLKVGDAADLCLLDRKWSEAKQGLGEVKVNATWINGALVYNRVN